MFINWVNLTLSDYPQASFRLNLVALNPSASTTEQCFLLAQWKYGSLFFLLFHLIPTMQEFLVRHKARARSSVCQPSWVCTHRSSSPLHPANKRTKPTMCSYVLFFYPKPLLVLAFRCWHLQNINTVQRNIYCEL